MTAGDDGDKTIPEQEGSGTGGRVFVPTAPRTLMVGVGLSMGVTH